jgi:hypothetical protein
MKQSFYQYTPQASERQGTQDQNRSVQWRRYDTIVKRAGKASWAGAQKAITLWHTIH